MDNGANPNQANDSQKTPLHLAVLSLLKKESAFHESERKERKRAEEVVIYLATKSDLILKDKDGKTALEMLLNRNKYCKDLHQEIMNMCDKKFQTNQPLTEIQSTIPKR